ncbi:hypothetical protein TNCT_326741, partial [Trichonephila clavata]
AVGYIHSFAKDPDTKSFSCYAVSEALGETIVQTYTVAVVCVKFKSDSAISLLLNTRSDVDAPLLQFKPHCV